MLPSLQAVPKQGPTRAEHRASLGASPAPATLPAAAVDASSTEAQPAAVADGADVPVPDAAAAVQSGMPGADAVPAAAADRADAQAPETAATVKSGTLDALTALVPEPPESQQRGPAAEPQAEASTDESDKPGDRAGGEAARSSLTAGVVDAAHVAYVDGGSNITRVAVVGSFAFSLIVFAWAGTVERLAQMNAGV